MKKLAITAAILVTGYTALRVYLGVHAQVIVDRFPDLPEQEVRKAYAEIMKRALTDPNFQANTDEELDALLRSLVTERTTSAK